MESNLNSKLFDHIKQSPYWLKKEDEDFLMSQVSQTPTSEFEMKSCQKLIHFIWLKKSPSSSPNPPKNFTEQFLPAWKELNPDYEIILWDDQKV